MASIDWNKMAQDYEKSILDSTQLYAYAQKIAEKLLNNRIQFDGYTDAATKDFWEESKNKGFLKTLFKDRSGLDYQHFGYWTLETSSHNYSGDSRVSYPHYDPHLSSRGKKFSVLQGASTKVNMRWVLLFTGQLALFSSTQKQNEIDQGHAYNKKDDNMWRIMTTDDILLLDHKKRDDNRNVYNRNYYTRASGSYISSANYLLTDKKVVGVARSLPNY